MRGLLKVITQGNKTKFRFIEIVAPSLKSALYLQFLLLQQWSQCI